MRACVPDVRSGVYSGVPRRTLWNTGSVVDDVFITAWLPVLVQLFSLLTLVVELLELKRREKKQHMTSHISTSVSTYIR